MAKNKLEIITDIKTYIAGNGNKFNEWFVGVSTDATASLLTQHKVDQKLDKWVFRTAPIPGIAKEVEYYFVKILGASGSETAADSTADKVYAYKKSDRTTP